MFGLITRGGLGCCLSARLRRGARRDPERIRFPAPHRRIEASSEQRAGATQNNRGAGVVRRPRRLDLSLREDGLGHFCPLLTQSFTRFWRQERIVFDFVALGEQDLPFGVVRLIRRAIA